MFDDNIVFMSRTKKNSLVREAMCERFVAAMAQLPLAPTELARALGYTNATTIAKVQRGEAFVDIERLHAFATLKTNSGEPIDLNWLITGRKLDQINQGELTPFDLDAQVSDQSEFGFVKSNRKRYRLNRVAKHSQGKADTINMLIHGENLAALTLLQDTHQGKIRCAYLDPPYNNGDTYTHYSDNKDHDEWLATITKRMGLVRGLLQNDGSIWISIDDSELHYLKIAADTIFGRHNFIGTLVWERRTTRENRKPLSRNHEYILAYAKHIGDWAKTRNAMPLTDDVIGRYKNPDNDPRGPWQSVSANVQDGHATPQQYYEIKAPNGRIHWPPKGRCWIYPEKRMNQEIGLNNIWFGRDGSGVPRIKHFLSTRKGGLAPDTLWRANDVGTTADAKKHLHAIFHDTQLFDTPKPEALLARILHISTNPGDLVLDPYLGSGTTAAVAQKMERSYIGIENGDHIKTHCVSRLTQVIGGEAGGISGEYGWKGGGSFNFFELSEVTSREK